MLLLVLSVALQIALIVHVVRSGRPVYWIFIILFLSLLGALAYVVVELLPELAGNPRVRRAIRQLRKTVDPGADLRRRERQHRLSGSVDAARHLANELIEAGEYEAAIPRYEEALTGLYEHDPDLLLGLARAQFGSGRHEAARATLERLTAHNPDYRSADGHLLYARAAEACGDLESAEHEYAAVSAYYAGAEAKFRYAALLERLDEPERARELYEDIVATADLAPRHYRRAQRRWIAGAKEGLRRLAA